MPDKQEIRPGGLFRCCIETIKRLAPSTAREGDSIRCMFCAEGLRFREGAWEWDH